MLDSVELPTLGLSGLCEGPKWVTRALADSTHRLEGMSLLHQTADASIRSISVSKMNNNVYLVTSRRTGAQVLIDAADDAPAIERMLRESSDDSAEPTHLELVVTTHRHADHVRALATIAETTGAPLAAGVDDADAIEETTGIRIRDRLAHGDTVEVDGMALEVIHLRGHTPGSVALALRDQEGPTHLLTGDSLFPGGVGNTWDDAERFEQLLTDVTERVFNVFPDETLVHPGHGAGTTLGTERPHLTEWRERGW